MDDANSTTTCILTLVGAVIFEIKEVDIYYYSIMEPELIGMSFARDEVN